MVLVRILYSKVNNKKKYIQQTERITTVLLGQGTSRRWNWCGWRWIERCWRQVKRTVSTTTGDLATISCKRQKRKLMVYSQNCHPEKKRVSAGWSRIDALLGLLLFFCLPRHSLIFTFADFPLLFLIC